MGLGLSGNAMRAPIASASPSAHAASTEPDTYLQVGGIPTCRAARSRVGDRTYCRCPLAADSHLKPILT